MAAFFLGLTVFNTRQSKTILIWLWQQSHMILFIYRIAANKQTI